MLENFDEIRDRYDELDSIDDALCIGALTQAAYMSGARAQMFTQHLLQSHVPINGEIPLVSTRYEHMVGEFSGAYYRTDNKIKVIHKIQKHGDYVYTLIVKNKKTNEYDVIYRHMVNNLAETHGYKWNNEEIDKLDEGDNVDKNKVLYRSPSLDEYGNFMFGVNAKVAYVISPHTIEDAMVISESFAKKLSVTKVDTCMIPINDNDIPLNIYGKKHSYKSFPNVGEMMKHSILCAVRRRDKMYNQYSLKNSKLRKIFSTDDVYQFLGNWRVADIDIWSNKPLDEIPDVPAYRQVKEYLENQIRYWTEVYDTLKEIIDGGKLYTKALSDLFAKARDYLAEDARHTYEERMFSNIMMEFTLTKDDPCMRGCKLSGRFGNKSVISAILPDEEMGITEDGIIPDIRVDALGVIGRLNSGQIFEQELNWTAEKVRQNIIKMGDPDDKKVLQKQWKYLLDFVGKVDKDQQQDMMDIIPSYGPNAIHQLISELISGEERILLHQKPMDCIGGDGMERLFYDYDMHKSKIYYKNEYGKKYAALREIIVADEYMMRLKQEPHTKYSARPVGIFNPTSWTPMKSLGYRKHKTLFQDQANKIDKVSSGRKRSVVRILSKCWNDLKALMPKWSESRNKLRDIIW